MEYKSEYERWVRRAADEDIRAELTAMDQAAIEDAFYRDLAFGTGGLRGVIGAGTNRMNRYVVAKASQGLSRYLLKRYSSPAVVIGYDTRIKSDEFARTAAGVFAANGITVYLWNAPLPVPTVSYAVRYLGASQGVMITASHNPARYNGYKVYGSDGCQITTEAASAVLKEITALDIFSDVKSMDFQQALEKGRVRYIDVSALSAYIEEVKSQSVVWGDEIDRDVKIVYSPLNGTGLIPVTRALRESGFSRITVVEEQREPDGNFPTCPYPNPEQKEALALGLAYCERMKADLLLATDPDSDRCGVAVRDSAGVYQLLSGNEVGLLLLDYICSQRVKHGKMPEDPVFIKTIVTTDLAEKVAAHYGVRTVNVLTGFKFIGEQIGALDDARRYVFGFEESYGYLTGGYVRDKDGVDAAFMICEMLGFYKAQGLLLTDKLAELYRTYGYCLNTLRAYDFPGSAGMEKMRRIMATFRSGMGEIAGMEISRGVDYLPGVGDLPKSDVMQYWFRGENADGSIVIRPSGTEPKLKIYSSVRCEDRKAAEELTRRIEEDLDKCIAQ